MGLSDAAFRIYSILSTDTKPALIDGSAIFERDTGAFFFRVKGVWEPWPRLTRNKMDYGKPGSIVALDVGEGGSYSVDEAGATIVKAFSYDASADTGTRFTELTLTAANTLLGDAGDRIYVGSPNKFWAVRAEVGVAKSAELYLGFYWNGSALTAMTYMGINNTGADQYQNNSLITTSGNEIDISACSPNDEVLISLARDGTADTNAGKAYAARMKFQYVLWTVGEHV